MDSGAGRGMWAGVEDSRRRITEEVSPHSAHFLDPFSLRQSITRKEYCKIAFLSVTLLPLRVLLMAMLLVCAWVFGSLCLLGMPRNQALGMEPLVGWRRTWAKRVVEDLSRAVFFVGGWYRVPHRGRRAPAAEAPILLALPHSSFWDAALVTSLRCPGLVMKDSARGVPAFGGLLRFTQPLYVKSEDPRSRRETAGEIQRRVLSGEDYQQLLIFPEGGCGNRRAILQFKLGGFAPGVPVQPVFIRYKNDLDTITWAWDGPGALKQVWLTLCQFRIYCELEFLPVYKPSEAERRDARLFSDNVRNYVSRWTATPLTLLGLEDARFLQTAKQRRLPWTAAFVKFLRLRDKIGNQDMDPSEELQNLKLRDKVMGDAEAMAERLGLERCPEALRDFFYIIDQPHKGVVDVRVYGAALCLLRTDLSDKEKLKLAFQVLGSEAENLPTLLLLWKGIPVSLFAHKDTGTPTTDRLERVLALRREDGPSM